MIYVAMAVLIIDEQTDMWFHRYYMNFMLMMIYGNISVE
jgi:hypothetical protein